MRTYKEIIADMKALGVTDAQIVERMTDGGYKMTEEQHTWSLANDKRDEQLHTLDQEFEQRTDGIADWVTEAIDNSKKCSLFQAQAVFLVVDGFVQEFCKTHNLGESEIVEIGEPLGRDMHYEYKIEGQDTVVAHLYEDKLAIDQLTIDQEAIDHPNGQDPHEVVQSQLIDLVEYSTVVKRLDSQYIPILQAMQVLKEELGEPTFNVFYHFLKTEVDESTGGTLSYDACKKMHHWMEAIK